MLSSFAGALSCSCFWFSSVINLCMVGLGCRGGDSGLPEGESPGSFLSDARTIRSELGGGVWNGEGILSLTAFTFFSGGGNRRSSSWLLKEGLVSLGTLLLRRSVALGEEGIAFEGPLGSVERTREDRPNCSSLLKGCRQRIRTLSQLPSDAFRESFSASVQGYIHEPHTQIWLSNQNTVMPHCTMYKTYHTAANC